MKLQQAKGIAGIILFLILSPYLSSAQDSLYLNNRHQVGINASKFISLFNEQVNSIELAYRLKIKKPYSLRLGAAYKNNTADDGLFMGSLKLGVDKYFKRSGKWQFYYGSEAYLSRTVLNSSNRTTNKVGIFVFVGFLFHLSDQFSLSTEPNFSAIYVDYNDPTSFDPGASRSWYEFALGNMGQIQLNFHF